MQFRKLVFRSAIFVAFMYFVIGALFLLKDDLGLCLASIAIGLSFAMFGYSISFYLDEKRWALIIAQGLDDYFRELNRKIDQLDEKVEKILEQLKKK